MGECTVWSSALRTLPDRTGGGPFSPSWSSALARVWRRSSMALWSSPMALPLACRSRTLRALQNTRQSSDNEEILARRRGGGGGWGKGEGGIRLYPQKLTATTLLQLSLTVRSRSMQKGAPRASKREANGCILIHPHSADWILRQKPRTDLCAADCKPAADAQT